MTSDRQNAVRIEREVSVSYPCPTPCVFLIRFLAGFPTSKYHALKAFSLAHAKRVQEIGRHNLRTLTGIIENYARPVINTQ